MMCPCATCALQGCGVHHEKCEPYKAWKEQKNEANRKRIEEISKRAISRDAEMKYRKNLRQHVNRK